MTVALSSSFTDTRATDADPPLLGARFRPPQTGPIRTAFGGAGLRLSAWSKRTGGSSSLNRALVLF